MSLDKHAHNVDEQGRFELQAEAVRRLFNLRRPSAGVNVEVVPAESHVAFNGSTTVDAAVSGLTLPYTFRWAASRGHVVGESDCVTFYAGGRARPRRSDGRGSRC